MYRSVIKICFFCYIFTIMLLCSCDKRSIIERKFEITLPQEAEIITNDRDGFAGDEWYHLHLDSDAWKAWKPHLVNSGYNEWENIGEFHYSYGNFNLAGSDETPVFLSDKYPDGTGGDRFMIFYRPSEEKLDMVIFWNY